MSRLQLYPKQVAALAPPPWVTEVLGPAAKNGLVPSGSGLFEEIRESENFLVLRASVPEARSLGQDSFRRVVGHTYEAVGAVLAAREMFPLRFWNCIPGILEPMGEDFTRYEVFNAGRADAFRSGRGANGPRACCVAASAVGHAGEQLLVHVLAGRTPGLPVENSRQIPAYRYSRQYGLEPPRFARATRLDGPLFPGSIAPAAITAGTASIVGETTRHTGDVKAQVEETLVNLAWLSAQLVGDRDFCLDRRRLLSTRGQRALSRILRLRVYVVRREDTECVVSEVTRYLPHVSGFEVVYAELCRPGLWVEVEGVIDLGA